MERTMEFAEKVAELVGMNATVSEVRKGDEILLGIVVGEGNVRPTFYVDDIDGDAEEVADKIKNQYNTLKIPEFDYDIINDYSKTKDDLMICLRRPTNDDSIVKKTFLNMEEYVRVKVSEASDNESIGTFIVKPDMLKNWGITEDQLFEDAITNSRENMTIMDMASALFGNSESSGEIDDLNINDQMFIVSNKDKINGGVVLLMPDFLKKVADKLEDDLYILPSSIHESLITRDTEWTFEKLNAMVKEVNDTQVLPKEQQSDNAYHFSRETGEITY